MIISDIDGLKYINDHFGHKMGDQYIKDTACILKASIRKSDVVARIGGDEFGIILPHSGEIAAKNVLSRIKEIIEEYNKQPDRKFKVSISFGYAVSKNNRLDKDRLFREADNAMYNDKQKKKIKRDMGCTK